MSFSSDIKKELSELMDSARECRLAELSVISKMCGQYIIKKNGRLLFMLQSENFYAIKSAYYLIKRLFHAPSDVAVFSSGSWGEVKNYVLAIRDEDTAKKMLFELGFLKANGALVELDEPASPFPLKKDNVKRAYVRGFFIVNGMMSNPKKSYHLEIGGRSLEELEFIRNQLEALGVSIRVSSRKGKHFLYMKEGEQISDFLAFIGATNAFLEFENVRIVRDISGNTNRRVNCETANIKKTAVAGAKQLKHIKIIEEKKGLSSLPPELYELAMVKLENPELNLKELGELLDPPVGKSGIYHRFAKIKQIAEEL